MSTSINLKDGAAKYIEHLETIGKKTSTVGTARRTMDLFVGHLGEGKEVGKILPVHVAGFFKSEAATTLKGKPRAKASIVQIRRIVRGALVYWHEQGLTEGVALPKDEKKFLEPRKNGKATAEPATESTEAQPDPVAPVAPVEPEQAAAESK